MLYKDMRLKNLGSGVIDDESFEIERSKLIKSKVKQLDDVIKSKRRFFSYLSNSQVVYKSMDMERIASGSAQEKEQMIFQSKQLSHSKNYKSIYNTPKYRQIDERDEIDKLEIESKDISNKIEILAKQQIANKNIKAFANINDQMRNQITEEETVEASSPSCPNIKPSLIHENVN